MPINIFDTIINPDLQLFNQKCRQLRPMHDDMGIFKAMSYVNCIVYIPKSFNESDIFNYTVVDLLLLLTSNIYIAQ